MNKIDSSIASLVKALNAFEGIETLGSCGGHQDPKPGTGQWEQEDWYVKFHVAVTEHGHFALEFLAWAVHDYARSGRKVILYPYAPPPFLNGPGKCLCYILEGHSGEGSGKLASFIKSERDTCYISPENAGEFFSPHTQDGAGTNST